uniref:Uncharacterized protein n=1 Tax=Amphimedon queenslandica TaxID=400682 RepID=A0A1X7UCP5_AMPQE
MEVSEPTHHLLTLTCTSSMSNDQRWETRRRYKLPRVPATKTPQLDAFMKAEAPQNAKSLDGELARIQTLVMDAAAPLTSLIEEKIQETENKGNMPEAQQLADAITASLALIGNAHSHISQLRREKVITSLNMSLLPLLKDDVDFATAVPFLFGTDFAKRSKDFTDQMPEAYKHSGSTSWKAGTLSKQLEGCYKRQVGTGHSEWVPDRVPFTSLSGLPTPPTTKGGSDNSSLPTIGLLCFHPVPDPKEGWRPEAGNQPKASKQLCKHPSFQDGGDTQPKHPP